MCCIQRARIAPQHNTYLTPCCSCQQTTVCKKVVNLNPHTFPERAQAQAPHLCLRLHQHLFRLVFAVLQTTQRQSEHCS